MNLFFDNNEEWESPEIKKIFSIIEKKKEEYNEKRRLEKKRIDEEKIINENKMKIGQISEDYNKIKEKYKDFAKYFDFDDIRSFIQNIEKNIDKELNQKENIKILEAKIKDVRHKLELSSNELSNDETKESFIFK